MPISEDNDTGPLWEDTTEIIYDVPTEGEIQVETISDSVSKKIRVYFVLVFFWIF